MPDSCQKAFSLVVSEGDAPCTLFEADNTLFPVQSIPFGTDGAPSTVNFPLEIGDYLWNYEGGVYQWTFGAEAPLYQVNAGAGCAYFSTVCRAFLRMMWDRNDGFGTLGFTDTPTGSGATQLAAETVFEANLAASPQQFIIAGGAVLSQIPGTGIIRVTGDDTLGATMDDTTFGPPQMSALRTRKLITTQPIQLTIQNLATYANGRFQITYDGEVSAALAFNANAAMVQGALNAMVTITADGGVVCAGTLAAGMTITWNVNGNRSQATAVVTTVSPGIVADIVTTQNGTGILPEIQQLTVNKYCADFLDDVVSPEWNGVTLVRNLVEATNLPYWRVTQTLDPAPTQRFQNLMFSNMHVGLNISLSTPATAVTAAIGAGGNVNAGTHRWKVAFITFGATGGPSPVSNALVLGVASQVNLTNIPIGPAGTTDRVIYRTLATDPNGVFYQVGNVGDNVTTAFTDNVDDAAAFNGGFGVPIKPIQCFWQCVVRVDILFPGLGAVLWSGIKLTGQTPEGVYTLAYPWDVGSIQCPFPTTGLTPSLTLVGTF